MNHLFRKELAMKPIILGIAVLGVLSILSAPVMAGGPVHSNIVHVTQYYHGGYHGPYHAPYHANYHASYHPVYHGAYYGGGYPVYVQPAWGYPVVASPLFPPHPSMFPQPVYEPYYNYPSASFYYSSPELSIGVGF
jgi:hypothetical protein